MSDETTISNEETTATIVDGQQPRTETQQAAIDYQQQGFNLALVRYDRERCVHQEIERQTKLIPSKAAIAYRGRELSYGELNAQANRMARYLVRMGVGKGDLVGIFMRRTPQMVAAMLGVWKAGAGYVPLDPQYPQERLRFMLQDAPSKLVITTNSVRDRVGEIPSKILYVDEEREQIEKESTENLDEVLSSGQVAYVIYTAGSTGAARGVMLAHQSAMSFVTWAKSAFQPEELEGVLAAASIGSDLSIFELWATLSCGGTVVLANDLMDWWEHIDDEDPHPVRLINTLPSAMTKLIQQGSLPKSVRTVNLTGETLHKTLVGQLSKAGALKRVNNLYGQSETTIYSIWTTVGAGDKVTVGRAVANTQLYVLDEEMQLVTGGVAGELYVGGDGLALGYLKNFRLTAERFLPNPFSQGNGSRMYRTGDVVRWQEDGQMEYLSRADQQVRLGGYRIKLEEIEAAVLDHAGVSQAVVVVRPDHSGEKRLMGYVVGRGKKIDVGQLRGYLQQRLPEYMVPSAFQQLDSLPLTPNDKIDRKALAALESRETIEETGAPVLTPAEELITGVWSGLLGKSNIGRDDNFFGLGGHSLLVTQVISRIREVFQVELPMQVMFETPTVAGLARSIESSTRIEAPPLRRCSRLQPLRLSFGQERLRFLSHYELETSLYNVPIAMRLRGALNIEAVKASLQEMVNRHEVLRTSFPEVGDSTIQDIAAEMEVPFAVAEIREDELDEVLREQARRSFDLSHGPLIRASLFRISSQDHVLLVVTHHIVSDGWSLGVMLREFNVLYDSFSRGVASPLPPLPIQYADYSEWQREWLQGEVLERQLDYWRKQLAGHETLNLPTDRPHSAKPTLAGAMERARLPEPLVSQLKLFSDQQGVTLFMTLLAGFQILLYRYTGQTDISVGSGIANRNRQELEPLIGFFVNTLVLRTQFTEDSSVAELLQRVRDVSLQAYAHQDIPFERLVEALDPARELSRTPFFQALFVLQNAPLPTVSWDGLEATASILETGTAKFDLTLSAREEEGELELSLEYRTELFNAERMKRLLQHYRTLLEQIVVSVDSRISELEILSEAERQQLLVEWNRTEAPYSTNQCVHQLFEEQAAKTPQAVAVMDEDGQISYGELNRRANQLAHYLVKMGVEPEVGVGICMERNLEMVVALMGILKAGGAYVPLDPADPSARRSSMVKDAGAKFVLTNERFIQQMAGCAEHGVDLEKTREEIEKQSGDNLKVHLDVENLAWVIYTSSSAGRPKGTAIPHCSAVSMLQRTLIDAMDQNPSVERWLNLYTPTGDATYATYAEVKRGGTGALAVERPLSNTQVYVLDKRMKPVPIGITGELYLGGAGQARGYLNRPELTAEKFIPNPFSQTSGERLYRTGDLVRYQENGNLEFLGRLDDQVKIQGYRIEPGEIEAALLDYPGVTQAAVTAREDKPEDVRLVGYVAGSERLDVDRLRGHLQQRVPEYMVPAALLQLDTLPLTTNGKVDRKALLELGSKEAMEEAGSLALTPTEELIAGVWSSLLGKSEIRRDDNFFDLGGHSLMVTQMLSRLKQVFHREIELRAMFESPVLKDFSAYVDRLSGPAQLATLRPILPASRDGDLLLSLQQEQLWFLEQITAGSTVYSLPDAVRLKGDLDKLALRVSLEEIVRRHEILRTSFVQADNKPKQRIHETGNFDLVERDLRETANGVATEESINREQKEEAASPFLLSQPKLFRAKLLRVAEQEHILLLTFHHIVFDGWSIGVMVNELGQLYKAYHEGRPSPLPELPVQYADYAVWQREVMAEGEFVDDLEYWKKELEDLSELDLPSDHPRPAVQSFRGIVERWEMPKEASAAIRKVSQDQGVTLFMTLLAGFQILLARYSGQRDIVVGSPIANRAQPELEALIGFFVNTLVLRGNVNGDLTVEAVLQRTREVCLGGYAHQSVPFERLVDELQPERDLSRSPLFQVMFALQNAPAGALQMHGVEISMLPSATSGARFDLTLMVEDDPEHLRGMMEYCTDLYERPTVRRMLDHYQQVLSEIARDPGQLISTLPLLSPAERQQLLAAWNHPYAESQHKCLHELFEQQANLTPKALAVAHKGRSLTYSELNQRANQLGHYLKKLGVGSEELVGVLLPRCSELLVAMLGVLKAGAAYVVLDPDDRDQLAYILKDARPDVIVSEQGLRNKLPALSGRTVYLDAQWNESSQESEQNVEAHVHPENLAYVTYRSEGTKAPEGVAVQHGTVASLVCWAKSVLSADDLQRVLTSNPPTSDLSILDTYVPLCCGGTVVVVDDSFDGINLEEGNATLMNVTPSVMRELLGRKAVPASVRTIMLAGEPVSSGLVRKIYDNCDVKRVLNLYGHSEISLGSTIAELQPGNEDKKVSIGRPVENAQAFVLDAHMELVPAGIAGELYLSAATSARGYFHRPDLTAERLVPNVFSSGGERLFRTGELARHKANGEFELWGRVGYETRIRGHRVELEEVEKALERQPEVADAVVIIPQTGAAENKLVAYIVPQKTGATAGDALERTLRAALKQRLPEYMVPSYWATLERLPLLPDGKLDRSALPAVQPKMEEAGSLALTPTEELIADVWSGLLGKSEIRRDDNFFDLGGHSLMVIQMLSRLRQVFNREIDVRSMFESPILKDLAAYVDQLTGSTQQTAAIRRVDRKGKLALSYGQERLWFIYQLEPENVAYNVPGAVRIQGPLDVESLERTLREIVRRHESLRTRFMSVVGEPQQIIDASIAVEVPVTELSHLAEPEREAEARRLAREDARQPFDLARGPLFRVKLLRLASQDHVLVFNMHHIVSDGWSVGVLVREVSAIYNNFSTGQPSSLPELDIQYADFSAWQREFLSGSLLEKQLEYWKQKLAAVEPLMLPTDRPRTALQRPEGATTHFTVPVELTEALKTLSRKQGATLYMILLAAFQALLSRYSGQSDITVGSPIAGRSRTETEGLIGVFINTLVLRSDLSGQPDSIELLQRVKATTLEAFANQDVPFEKLVEVLLPQRDLTRSPLFQVMFVLQNVPRTVLQLGAAKMLAFDVDSGAAQFEMSLVLAETDSGMEGSIVYNKGLFEASSVIRMIDRYQMLLNGIVAEPSQSIALLPLMTVQERKQVIEEWNRTEAQYPLDKCVHELFEEQVGRSPQATAVVFEEEELSYGELNARANRLAHYLRELGVKPETRVAICVERGFEMIVGLLAILKAGGAYVPLDPAYPTERLQYMLEDSAPILLLTQEHLQGLFGGIRDTVRVLDLTDAASAWSSQPETNPDRNSVGLTSKHLAYVIYTSGSTGQPKGVMVEHMNVARLFTATAAWFQFSDQDVWSLFHSYAFDFSVWEIWGALLYGGRLVVISRETARSPRAFYKLICQERVTILNQTPSAFRQLISAQAESGEAHQLRHVIFGGEALEVASLKPWYEQNNGGSARLINMYGITETTVHVTYRPLEQVDSERRGGDSPIGCRIPDLRIYILDSNRQPVPVGVSGEMYVGGAGVARGYLKRPELTAERFLADPFSPDSAARIYRTGDLGRWLADGNIEFVGRNDNQVKIRGFRIELGEIEAVLQEHGGVRQAVVLAREDTPGDKRLVTYYTCRKSSGGVSESSVESVGAEQLRAHLSAILPDYMVPAAYVRMESLPLTPNGKLDRKALPAPEQEAYAVRGYEEPVGEMETKLAEVWGEVLQLEKVGRHDNFFELGGHSLLAVRLIERLRQMGVQVEVRTLFATPTLADLAAKVDANAVAVEIPANRIPAECAAITPEMLPLVALTQEEIDRIVGVVPGGAANVQDIYPLAPLQEGILFHHLMGGEGDPYLLAAQLSFDSRSRMDHFIGALQAVIQRHDILRTAVMWEGLSEPVQVVWREAPLQVGEIELKAAGGDAGEQLYARFDPRRFRMDVRQAPLLRLYVAYDRERDRWLMMVLLHHLIDDNTSLKKIQAEVQAHLLGEAEQLPAPLPFRNLVAQARLGVSREEHEAFFRKLLGDIEEPTAPFGLLDVQGDGRETKEARVLLNEELARRLRANARRLRVSAASLCHLAWARVLAKVSGREDVVFGTVLFGRMQGGEGADRVMGLFINTLPIRIQVGEEGAVASVRRTHALLADLLCHEHASLALAQRCSRVAAPTPLFSALLNYRQNAGARQAPTVGARQAWEGIEMRRVEERTNYPITLSVDDLGQGFELDAQTSCGIEPMRVCDFMSTALASLVTALETAPDTAVRILEILPEAERDQVLYGWNETKAEFPSGKCVHELFEEQVGRSPEARAVVFEEEELSYGELNARANRLAHYLRELGVKPETRVAICVERGFEMIVGLLAILKAGGAYVPLDPAYPTERLQYMLEDSAPILLLTQEHLQGLFGGIRDTVRVLDLTDAASAWSSQPETNPDRNSVGLTSKHLAYVIYTSGSTGQPKGVMVEHMNVARLFTATAAWFQFSDQDVWSLFHSYAFDFSVWEIWGALLYGGRLVVISRETARSPRAFYKLICQERVTILNQTPSAFRQLISAQAESGEAHQLRHVIFGGEALEVASLKPWYEQNNGGSARLINMYGITETTVHVTYRPLEQVDSERRGGDSPIGCRIPDLRIYILDSNRQPVPVGVSGEMYVGGAGVARGYLKRPELTAERFLADPFSPDSAARIYRTGDLGRWLADGNIEFVGRNDNQVKIRGFRIELGEIEAVLQEHGGVRQAVVLAREDTPGDKRLVTYYTCRKSSGGVSESSVESVGAEQLRAHLSAILPDYMVPAAYVRMESLPLTPNGKLDRKALPAPEQEAYAVRGYEEPVGEMETKLAEVWGEVLQLEKVGRHDNFFELGGHSLLAVRLIERLRQMGVQVEVRTLFATPTLADLAAKVDANAVAVEIPANRIPAECAAITPEMLPLVALTQEEIDRIVGVVPGGAANVQDIYPLAPLQEGILFHHLMGGEGDPYLLAAQLSFDSRSRMDHFIGALQAVIQRHDILRTAVMWEGLSEPVQVVWREAPLQVGEIELKAAGGDAGEQLYARFDPRRFRMDVRQAPLLRLYVAYDRERDRWLMMVLLHHLIDDNTSLKKIQAEVQAHLLGEAEQLPAPLPFRNLVAQARLGVSREEHEAFFRKLLGDIEEPTAPFGLLDVQGDGRETKEARVLLNEELARRLRANARRLRVSAASLCHLAWARVLAKVSGREDVVFGTVLFGRMQGGEGADRVMGLFINTLPIRIQVGEEGAVASVRRTHALLADLLCHEHASLALAQRCSRVAAPTPLFSALLNYRQNAGARQAPTVGARQAWEGIEMRRVEERTNYPITLSVDDLGQGFELDAQTSCGIEPMRVCDFMSTALASLVTALETAPDTAVRILEILPEAERDQVLYGWNETKAEFPSGKCVHELFEEQVGRSPEARAVVFEEEELSYGELNARANRLAHYLRELGVKPETRVAICVERGFEMIVGLLAILKAGGAYVPLDPAYPTERLDFMLHDAQATVLLTQEGVREKAGSFYAGRVVCLEREWADIAQESGENLSSCVDRENLAYLIYTSGSTGRPKAVGIRHGSVAVLLHWARKMFSEEETAGVLASTSMCFDLSVFEMFVPLSRGGRVLVVDDALKLADMVGRQKVTLVNTVPSAMAELVRMKAVPASVRVVNLAGEALSRTLVNQLYEQETIERVFNLYGPSEDTTYSTYEMLRRDEPEAAVSIGRPLANSQVYVLDESYGVAPVGVAGELYIGGDGLARGYLNRPELTAEKFVPNPFSTVRGERLYRTGDRVKWRAEGKLDFLGRLDQQVKMRGFRIELGEIEAVLREHEGVREAIVVAREDTAGDKKLVAYVVGKAGDLTVNELRSYLKERLPEYLVPSVFVQMKHLPLTPNGKVDRRSLPLPTDSLIGSGKPFVAPRNVLETQLAEIWEDLLVKRPIGVTENFFDVGGHSILAVRLTARIERQLGKHLPLAALFPRTTIESLAQFLRNGTNSESWSPLVPIQSKGSNPPLFFVHAVGGQVLSYINLGRHLGEAQPLYGLQSRQGVQELTQHTRLEEMASEYVEAIRAMQPIGPYRLGGWSMGGVIAFEMARQMQEQGQEIALLALVDSYAPSTTPAEASEGTSLNDLANFALYLGFTYDRIVVAGSALLPLPPGEQLVYLLSEAKASGLVTADMKLEDLSAMWEVFKANSRVMTSYRGGSYQGKVTLFRAESILGTDSTNQNGSVPEDPERGWGKWAAGGVEVIQVPGNHFTMIHEPHVKAIAEQLLARLEEAAVARQGDAA